MGLFSKVNFLVLTTPSHMVKHEHPLPSRAALRYQLQHSPPTRLTKFLQNPTFLISVIFHDKNSLKLGICGCETERCESGCAEDITKENNLPCIQDKSLPRWVGYHFRLVWKKTNTKIWADKLLILIYEECLPVQYKKFSQITVQVSGNHLARLFNFRTMIWNIFTLQ